MRNSALLIALLLPLYSASAAEASRTVTLAPEDATLGLRAYALGLMPVEVRVGRFVGTLTYNPADPARCTVRMVADVASVETSNPDTRATLLGPEFMDVARFPTLTFTGICAPGDLVTGNLTMRGVTRPLELSLDWGQHRLIAHGQLRRALWGMSGRPFVVGPTIGIRMATKLP